MHVSPGPAGALCVQSVANVCDMQFKSLHPWWNAGAEAGERNESCAVNHRLPRRRRGETHAESSNCKKPPPQHSTALSPIHLHHPKVVCSVAARLNEGLSWAVWLTRFHSLLFSHSGFTSWAISLQSSFVPRPTCFHKPALRTAEAGDAKEKGWSDKDELWNHPTASASRTP